MSLKLEGYICDKCSKVILDILSSIIIQNIIDEKPGVICRIYCPSCGEIVKRAEHTMKLEGSTIRKGTE